MTKNVIITGISGFIGKSFAKFYKEQNWEVSGLTIELFSLENINIILSEYSIIHLTDIFKKVKPDVIIHTAGSSSVLNSINNPDEDFRGSVCLTQNLLESVRLSKIKPLIVYPSSASVYGNPLKLPVSEESAMSPISPYGYHKLICEQLLTEYNSIYNIPVLILRLFSVFGVLQKKLLIWELFDQFQNKSEVVLKGTGFETRDYVYIDDLVKMVFHLIEAPERSNLIYNLASGFAVSIKQIVSQMAQYFPTRSIIYHENEVQGNPSHWQADVSLLNSVITYKPISFDIALRDVIHKWTENKSD